MGTQSPMPNAAQRALVGRRYIDADDGLTWAVFATGYDPESKIIVAYIYDTAATSDPHSLLECEYMSADELADGKEYDWLDGKPGRLGGCEEAAAADGAADSAADGAADGEGDHEAPSDAAIFAELELARVTGADLEIGAPDDHGGSDGAVPLISFGDQPPVACMPATEKVMQYSDRNAHEFFAEVSVRIGDKTHTFRRSRNLDDDACPVFLHGDLEMQVRLRVEDISRDADSVAWLHGSCMYSKAQLPPAVVGSLPPSFDSAHELVESIDPVQVPAAEVNGVVHVLSTSAWRARGSAVVDTCHQEAAFVEEFDDTAKWKVAPVKRRDENEPGVGARRRPRR